METPERACTNIVQFEMARMLFGLYVNTVLKAYISQLEKSLAIILQN